MSASLIELESHKDALRDKRSFITRHNLIGHPLMSLDSLSGMIQRLPADQVFFSSASVNKDADFDRAWIEHRSRFSLSEALTDLASTDAYIMVRAPETDPEYQPLFQQLLACLQENLRSVDPDVRGAMLYLFVSSPNSTTPFHIDRYSTLLMQFTGSKTLYLWPHNDRITVPEESMENLFADRKQRGPKLAGDREQFGQPHVLHPGDTLHIPFTAPHWVRNGPEVSISLSIIYRTRKSDRMMNAYELNHVLRKRLDWNPRQVGVSPLMDLSKDLVLRGYKKLRSHT
jgi:hypothetical protein